MAIVRTTRKETNSTGAAPPAAKTAKPVVKTTAGAASHLDRRGGVQNRTLAQPKSGDAGRFINETTTELRRVVWPTREEVRAGAIVTIGLLIFFAFYIFALDYIANWLFHALGLYPPPTR
jgi:preprotein translocase SecE subunit